MNLHTESEAFRELIELAADYFGYERSHVEKDYWVAKTLKGIAGSEFADRTYFKGGTCLSKGYDLIERFSEDLDLFVFTGDKESSISAEKKLNRDLFYYIKEQNKDIDDAPEVQSGGDFRKLYFAYDKAYEGGGLKDRLEVEIKCCDLSDKSTIYYPSEPKNIKSIITQYLEETGNTDLVEKFTLAGFDFQCLSPKKTICDKISRLVRLSYSDNSGEAIAKYIRDVYDLYQLSQCPEYEDFLESDEFLIAMLQVTVEDNQNNNSKSHLPLSVAPLFKNPEEIMKLREVAKAFNEDLPKLLFNKENIPSLEDVISVLSEYRDALIKFDFYRKRLNEKNF